MTKNMIREELLTIIEQAQHVGLKELNLIGKGITELPPEIGQLTSLKKLYLGNEWNDENGNRLTKLPDEIGQLTSLQFLNISGNRLMALPESIGQLTNLQALYLSGNRLTELPESIGQLTSLQALNLSGNQLILAPNSIGQLAHLKTLIFSGNQLTVLPNSIDQLTGLQILDLRFNQLTALLEAIGKLTSLHTLYLSHNQLTTLPESIGQLTNLKDLQFKDNRLTSLPSSLAQLKKLEVLGLDGNPLNPALQSAYDQGLGALRAYLRSLEEAEPLYEAKLVLVGEGKVGKTTLLNALTGREPREDEPTTHGVSIAVEALHLTHPERPDVKIQFNAWDFGGQEVYRVTHQFFFSRRSIYLLVWEPRMGVQQCQVEDWLKLIRLRVGNDAKVIIVSTHSKTGQRIARIDEPVFKRDFGSMIVDFVEVDSLVDDPNVLGEKFNIPQLKALIAKAAKDLDQMGMPFNIHWRTARDELLEIGPTQPRAAYTDFTATCARHGLDAIDIRTLAGLMHDLGYIVYYGDDERLKDDVVLQPEWLTKAIGFLLEDRTTQERQGILPDAHLRDVWLNHSFTGEPKYEPELYPFFLRLMEKYDVSYRLKDGLASLVAQHVPQVQPPLPWLPEEEPSPDKRRLAMVCVMDEAPPGLIPWMIVRTHEYAYELQQHHLHWQKGMFLRHKRHGEAVLELRGREFHLYTEAVWPEYFMNVLRQTLSKLIRDNWPGMEGRYFFSVPCQQNSCEGRFDIQALRQFLEDGDTTYRCQKCHTRQNIVELLFGFEDEEPRKQLARIEAGVARTEGKIDELESRLANYVMAIMRAMANEAKDGPRLFDIQPMSGNWWRLIDDQYRLRLWCEAEGCQHPVLEKGQGVYELPVTREWVRRVAPYAKFVAGMLKTLVPMVTPGVDILFGAKTIENLGIGAHLDMMKELTDKLPEELKIFDPGRLRQGVLSEDERSGLLALHALLRELDPNHANLGLHRVPTYTGDYLWLCQTHYDLSQPKIPDKIE